MFFKSPLKWVSHLARRVRHETLMLTPTTSSTRVNQVVKWLAPGLLIKRWLFLSVAGVVLIGLGLMVAFKLTPVFYTGRAVGAVLRFITHLIPSYISGPLVILGGLWLILWGQTRTLSAITDVLMPGSDTELVDVLLTQRRLLRGPKLVTLGGGRGCPLCCGGSSISALTSPLWSP